MKWKNGRFTQGFTLPDNVDGNKIEASFKDGMLNVDELVKSPKSAFTVIPAKAGHAVKL